MTCTTCGLSALGIAMDGKPYCHICVNWKVELKAHRAQKGRHHMKAPISDSELKALAERYRANANLAPRLHKTETAQEKYARQNNLYADMIEELLERRKAA